MDDGRVVAVADKLSDTAGRHLRVLLSQIHRHLSHLYQIALAALARHLTLLDIVVTAHLLENLVDGERMVVDLHCTLNDTLGQTHIDIGVVDNGIGHQ